MINFTLNGHSVWTELPDGVPLIDVLRNGFGLLRTRFGCGAEQCGSCMVLVDGRATPSCMLGVGAVAGRLVQTVEGLGSRGAPHPLQSAFLIEQAGQCGYCLSGILISAAALLAANPEPDEAAVRSALDKHLCRCGSHNRIVRAVLRAAREMRAAERAVGKH